MSISIDVRKKVLDLWDCCAYCGISVDSDVAWHVDHVVPKSKGGGDLAHNLVRACAQCNLSKGALLPYEWRSSFDNPMTIRHIDIAMRTHNLPNLTCGAPGSQSDDVRIEAGYLTINEAATEFNVSVATLRRRLEGDGIVGARKERRLKGDTWIIPRTSLRYLWSERTEQIGEPVELLDELDSVKTQLRDSETARLLLEQKISFLEKESLMFRTMWESTQSTLTDLFIDFSRKAAA